MADKIRDIQAKIMEQLYSEDGHILAASSYVPLGGWVYPFFFKKGDQLAQFHSLQAMHLNLVIVVIYFSLWIIENFPLTSVFFGPGNMLHPLSRTFWLVSFFAYIGFSGVSGYKAFAGSVWEIPYLKTIVSKTFSFLKSFKKKL